MNEMNISSTRRRASVSYTHLERHILLKRDIIRGAKGLKLHPILQNVPLTDERTYAAVEVFGEMGLPITSRCV